MGTYTPKPYKQFNRKLNQWVWVYPQPVEYEEKRTISLDNLIPQPYKIKKNANR